MRPQLSIIVPCYNEEKNIPILVERFLKIKPDRLDTELILVDNGSTDNSNRLISQYTKEYSFIRMVHVRKNIGYGFGIWSGLKEANGEYLCWTHGDVQTDLYDTIRAYEIIKNENKSSFVKGSRKGRSISDTFFTLGMSFFETLLLRYILYDINAQPNVFHRNLLRHVKNPPKDFSFDLYFYYIARKLNYKLIRFPVLFTERIHGESHWNIGIKSKIKFIRRTFTFSIKLKKNIKHL
jgi:glycosyltransferase involved in cell wall biosynthesis